MQKKVKKIALVGGKPSSFETVNQNMYAKLTDCPFQWLVENLRI